MRGLQLHGNRRSRLDNPTQGGNAFASFLLGYADSGQIDTPRFIGQQFTYFAGFAQDDWHVNTQTGAESGAALGDQFTADWIRQQMERLFPEHAKPRGRRNSGGRDLRRFRTRASGFPHACWRLLRRVWAAHRIRLFVRSEDRVTRIVRPLVWAADGGDRFSAQHGIHVNGQHFKSEQWHSAAISFEPGISPLHSAAVYQSICFEWHDRDVVARLRDDSPADDR